MVSLWRAILCSAERLGIWSPRRFLWIMSLGSFFLRGAAPVDGTETGISEQSIADAEGANGLVRCRQCCMASIAVAATRLM